MKNYKLFDKKTGLYVGNMDLYPEEIREIEKDFILRVA